MSALIRPFPPSVFFPIRVEKEWFETKEEDWHGRKASLRAEMRPEPGEVIVAALDG